MKTLTAMKKTGLVYFSSLTSKKKDELNNNILLMKHQLTGINEGLAMVILRTIDLNIIITQKNKIDELLKGAKCFKHKNKYYPLGIKEILNSI